MNKIIKGENLSVMQSILPEYKCKVKLIYIDPPYNTGNTKFVYKDKMKSDAWLLFMRERLQVAKEFLRDDGVIFVSIDDHEQAYLKVLMDEIFGRENFVACMPRQTKKAGKSGDGISKNHEYLLSYQKGCHITNKLEVESANYEKKDEFHATRGGYNLKQTLDYDSLQYSKTMDYKISINGIDYFPGGYKLFTERVDGRFKKIDWVWRWSPAKLEFGIENGFVVVKNNRIYTKTYENATISKKYDNSYFVEITKREKSVSSLFFSNNNLFDEDFLENIFSNDNASTQLRQLFKEKNVFSNPKPEALLERIIAISTQPGDLVMDFFLGSGTTTAVAHKMGRQYIGIEQMDYVETVALERMKKVIAGEQGGISKKVGWQGGGEYRFIDMSDQVNITQS